MNDQYSELYPSYQWFVPSQFNIAQACVHRWAENPVEGRRLAIFHENELGHREVWTYSRLSETSNQLASGLVKMGVLPGDRVAIVMEQRPETVASYMAVFSVGAVALPLSPRLSTDGLAARLNHADTRVAIVDTCGGPQLLQAQLQCPALAQVIGLDFQHEAILPWRSLLARQSTEFRLVPTKSTSPALLLYGSEATEAPKGVLLPHSALIGNLPGFVASQNWFPQKGDIFWTPADWTQANGLMGALLPSLYFGQAVVGTLGLFSPTRAFEIMERYQVTNTLLYPTALEQAMQEVPQPGERYKLALRAMAVTEKNMDQSTFEWSQQALGITPNEIFGHAETGHIVGNSHRKWMAKPGSIGRPYPGHRVAVVDAQGTPCAVGSVGEIALNRYDIHGHPDPALFLEYWRNEAATQAKFIGDWCLTGDLASIDNDGYYWCAGQGDKAI